MGQVIFKNLSWEDMNGVLKTIAWAYTKWDITPTKKYQLFLNNLIRKLVFNFLCEEEVDVDASCKSP